MRKAFGIMIGCILLCGLVMTALVAARESVATKTVTITGNPLEGVDIPWFELSYELKETVRWHNSTDKRCTLTFSGGPPFPRRVTIPAGGDSDVFSAADAPGPPKADWPKGRVYKVYHYSVDIEGGDLFDSPGGGIRP